jgi:NAD(P)H-flavin reductase
MASKSKSITVAAPPEPMEPRSYRIQRVWQETHDTFTLELEPADVSDGFDFAPGQFNMLYVFGVGEVPISISGDPAKPRTIVHTTRVVGTVTRAMHKLKRGDLLGVRGPFGKSWPIKQAQGRDVVVVPGGIGLAPLRPALYALMAQRKKFKRIVLLYGARTPEDVLFPEELKQWRSQADLDVHLTVDRATDASWRDNVGLVTTLIPRAQFDPAKAVAMVCGPEVMMRFVVKELEKRGMTDDRIYVSMERNMKCGLGLCGHCLYGPTFICKDGPVFRFDRIRHFFSKREV